MQEIEIIRGEEFKIAVKEEIVENDIFIKEYRRAAILLDEITGASIRMNDVKGKEKKWTWKQEDFENNIIAFCGDRGEGKSSAMMTFVNAAYEKWDDAEGIFSECRNLRKVHFSEPILIDPSMFDDVHNILDIVLAKIFGKFSDRYEQDNQCVDEDSRDRLVNQFQKVYRYVSLINNQEKMLDDEFDYEGNISKLSKLGESTNLKRELSKLIDMYLKFIDRQKENSQMIIAIDDLDLCSSNAYRMAEQIRKYLVIPNIAIVISVKIDQLELCVKEQNLRDFEKIYQNKEKEIYSQLNREVQIMAERYVAKLIPRQRRIYLPKIQNLDEVHIIYREQDGSTIIWDSRESKDGGGIEGAESSGRKSTCIQAMLKLLYDKTGMWFRAEKNGSSYLFPNNLRDMISWIVVIAGLDKEKNKYAKENNEKREDIREKDVVYHENILTFKKYFEREWSGDSFMLNEGLTLQDIGNMDTYHIHITVRRILEKIYIEKYSTYNPQMNSYTADRPDSFFHVMVLFDMCEKNIIDFEKEAYIYRLRSLYTMKMNSFYRKHQYDEMMDFVNGYIWGPAFYGIFPVHRESGMDRSRFALKTVEGFNKVLEKINMRAPLLEMPESGRPYYLSHISEEDGDDYIKAWIVLALFSNVGFMNNNQWVYSSNGVMVFENSQIYEYVQISLENYLVGLCNLEMLYDKINMTRLGIKREKYNAIADIIKASNEKSINCARKIVSNVDLALGIKDYCIKHRDYKKGTGKDSVVLGSGFIEKFFENVEEYMKQCGIECDHSSFLELSLGEEKIDVGLLYAEFFELSIGSETLIKQQGDDDETMQYLFRYRAKITEIPEDWNTEKHVDYHVSSSLRNLSAANTKMNLDDLASSIRQYNGTFKRLPIGLDVDGLCNLYGAVVGIYQKNRKALISKELHEEYKRLVRVQKEIEASY